MGGGGGRGWGRGGWHSCTRETPDNLQQVTEGSRIHRQGRREEEEEGCREGWRGNMHGMEMRVLTYQTPRCSPPTPKENGVLGGGYKLHFFFLRAEQLKTGSDETKLISHAWGCGDKRQRPAALSAAARCPWPLLRLLWPLRLSQVTSPVEQRGRTRGGAVTSPSTSPSSGAHALSSEKRTACPPVQRGNILARLPALPHSLTHNFFFLSSLPVPPSHSFPLPSLLPSPLLSLPPSLILSATLSVPFSFPFPSSRSRPRSPYT